MLIKFIFVGKTKDKYLSSIESNYLIQLKKFFLPELLFVKEEKNGETPKIKKIEGEKILEKVSEKDFLVLLDVKGQEFSSEEFAKKIEKISLLGKKITFVIGGAFGFSEEIKEKADLKISFSKMTFTHEMMRFILFEQLFRAFSILKGTKYHK